MLVTCREARVNGPLRTKAVIRPSALQKREPEEEGTKEARKQTTQT